MYQTLLKPLATDVKNFILDTLFPISCLSCGAEGEFTPHRDEVSGVGLICDDCKSTMIKLEHQRCIVCQKPTPFGQTHPKCQTPHGADGLISFYDYHDKKVSEIIIKGKYNFLPSTFGLLGQMVAKKLSEQYPHLINPIQQISLRPPGSPNFVPSSPGKGRMPDSPTETLAKAGGQERSNDWILTPIPLANSRRRWRGFNQAEVLCRAISRELSLPSISVLVRCKLTKTQKDLKKQDRLKNVGGAFALSPLFSKEGVRGSSFILIDDVTTTGATLQEAAKVLKRHGAAQVICLTVARD